MDLATLWFLIVAYLFAGFFFLEGFDYGVGILAPFISREEADRRMMLGAISGVWDGNEVWMVSAGAVLFAAFPAWYATLFSGMYLVFVFILVGLILRGVGIKFRNQQPDPVWRASWDKAIAAGSLLAGFLWGVVVGNLLRGIAINADMVYVGRWTDLFNPFSLATGAALVALFVLHGAMYLNIKLSGAALVKLQSKLTTIYGVTLLGAAAFLAYAALEVGLLKSSIALGCAAAAVVFLLICGGALKKNPLLAFWMSGCTIIAVGGAVFAHVYPRVLISSLDARWSMTIANTSSSPYSLKVMSLVALIFIPLVLVYQGWTYWILRKRIELNEPGY
ncbi:MAG: cytochrome d ubiquinol oxidase subunit II [Candidatus Omnitrophica bacterium]|nr:cytochrome d ubiquinol oxidase subunit II [Candidatus Omnitrophota bacterium]